LKDLLPRFDVDVYLIEENGKDNTYVRAVRWTDDDVELATIVCVEVLQSDNITKMAQYATKHINKSWKKTIAKRLDSGK
jgi:hypothetical protein